MGQQKVDYIILIHGWGGSLESMKFLQADLAKKFQVVTLDLPGFGLAPEPDRIFGIEDYAKVVLDLASSLRIKKFHLFGHSFGGQIATQIVLSHPNLVQSLILCNAAVIRRKSLPIKLKIKLAKIVKVLKMETFFKRLVKSLDYEKASPRMKQVLQKILQQDLTKKLSEIKTPTLLLWGEKDSYTPLWQAKIIHQEIPHSKLKVFDNFKHNLPITHHLAVAKEIEAFIKKL